MLFRFTDQASGGEFILRVSEKKFDRFFYSEVNIGKYYTLAWNNGPVQKVVIDEITYDFPEHSILPLMIRQSFRFEKPSQIVAWQFNSEFYCILNHDKEVSCAGFLFYGSSVMLFLRANKAMQNKLKLLLNVFTDEFKTADNVQYEMLQVLLKRLIILTTRLAREQYLDSRFNDTDKFDLVRQYNLLVELNFRKQHDVRFYAEKLNRSPKTLSNLFSIYNEKTPSQIIKNRLLIESKRLLYYTNKPAKEIAYELGFRDASYFSHFFKKHTFTSPQEFRSSKKSF